MMHGIYLEVGCKLFCIFHSGDNFCDETFHTSLLSWNPIAILWSVVLSEDLIKTNLIDLHPWGLGYGFQFCFQHL